MFKKTLVMALVVMMSGCFGSFKATRNVYHFNKTVHPNEWVQEGVFLGMVIIPVYGIATLLDAVIFNSVEFWTGRNPIAKAGDQQRVDGEDGSYAVSTLKADGSFDVVAVEANGTRHFFNLQKEANRLVARDVAGKVLASQVMTNHMMANSSTLAMAEIK